MTIDEFIARISRSTYRNCLYHFTDESNINSIYKRGLLSKAKMRSKGWWPKKTGGDRLSHDLDRVRCIDHCVSLCFIDNHPMGHFAYKKGRLPNLRYLGISPCVLKISEVRIAFGIANANDTEILPIEKAIRQIDFEVIYSWTDWKDPEINQRLNDAKKLEVLVPHEVPRNLIKRAY